MSTRVSERELSDSQLIANFHAWLELAHNYSRKPAADIQCSKAKSLLKEMGIDDYSLKELNDISFYLYGMQFADIEQAVCFLKS